MCQQYWLAKLNALLYGLGLEPTTQTPATADAIAKASDRALFDRIPIDVSPAYISHLLSGEQLSDINIPADLQLQLQAAIEQYNPALLTGLPDTTDIPTLKHHFWWLWRCLPDGIARERPEIVLAPASPILPDVSIWSQASLTAAMAGALAGYDRPEEELEGDRPYLATFTFTPIQDVI